MQGKKTYISLAVIVLGMFGASQYISEAEVATTVDAVLKLVGVAGVVYGRYVAKPKG